MTTNASDLQADAQAAITAGAAAMKPHLRDLVRLSRDDFLKLSTIAARESPSAVDELRSNVTHLIDAQRLTGASTDARLLLIGDFVGRFDLDAFESMLAEELQLGDEGHPAAVAAASLGVMWHAEAALRAFEDKSPAQGIEAEYLAGIEALIERRLSLTNRHLAAQRVMTHLLLDHPLLLWPGIRLHWDEAFVPPDATLSLTQALSTLSFSSLPTRALGATDRELRIFMAKPVVRVSMQRMTGSSSQERMGSLETLVMERPRLLHSWLTLWWYGCQGDGAYKRVRGSFKTLPSMVYNTAAKAAVEAVSATVRAGALRSMLNGASQQSPAPTWGAADLVFGAGSCGLSLPEMRELLNMQFPVRFRDSNGEVYDSQGNLTLQKNSGEHHESLCLAWYGVRHFTDAVLKPWTRTTRAGTVPLGPALCDPEHAPHLVASFAATMTELFRPGHAMRDQKGREFSDSPLVAGLPPAASLFQRLQARLVAHKGKDLLPTGSQVRQTAASDGIEAAVDDSMSLDDFLMRFQDIAYAMASAIDPASDTPASGAAPKLTDDAIAQVSAAWMLVADVLPLIRTRFPGPMPILTSSSITGLLDGIQSVTSKAAGAGSPLVPSWPLLQDFIGWVELNHAQLFVANGSKNMPDVYRTWVTSISSWTMRSQIDSLLASDADEPTPPARPRAARGNRGPL